MESGFIMALDYMIELAEKDQDDKVLFQVIFSFFSIDMDYSEPIFSCIVLIITTFLPHLCGTLFLTIDVEGIS